MTQEDINQAEWENPKNWIGPKWCSCYYSKNDARAFVPKQIRWMGFNFKKATPNFANSWGVCLTALIFLLLIALGVAIFNL